MLEVSVVRIGNMSIGNMSIETNITMITKLQYTHDK